MSADRYNILPDTFSIDIGSIPKNIIDNSVLYTTDSLEVDIEKQAIFYNDSPTDTKCIINFFKLSYCIFDNYKDSTIVPYNVNQFGVNNVCMYINLLYNEAKDIHKTCNDEHNNVLEARMCIHCSRRFTASSIAAMKLANSPDFKPPLKFGIAIITLQHHYLGCWYKCARCLPRQDAENGYHSD